jgi:glycosyltransferase involved in cell wall biosynthesis
MPLRLLLVNSHGTDETVGGTEGYVAKLAAEFADRGFEIRVLSAFPGPSTVPEEHTCYLHRTDWREDPVRRWRNHVDDVVSLPRKGLAGAIDWANPDLVHTHNLPGITTGIWEAARRAGVPVVHTLHDYHLLCPRVTLLRPDGRPCRPSPLLCGLRTKSLGRWGEAVSHVLGVSQYLVDRHAALFPHAERHVIRHPTKAPPSRSFRPPRSRLEKIGYIGALARTKGTDQLLAALPGLAELGCTVRIAGEGRLQAEVEEAARHSPVLSYDGYVSDSAKDAFLEDCDAGIIPSVWPEPGGPPWAMLDWLWAGRPVLVAPRGGLAEALEELPGALPVEPTSEGIVAAIAALSDPQAWQRAVAAVHPVSDATDFAHWFDVQEQIYRRAVGEQT